MSQRLVIAGGIVLATAVTVITGLLMQGAMPPAPVSAWIFTGLLVACLVYALAFGRKSD